MFRPPPDTHLYIGLATLIVVVSVVFALGVLKLESNLSADLFDLSRFNTAPLPTVATRPPRDIPRITKRWIYPQRWEYKVETYRVSEVLGIAGLPSDRLKEFGSQGWEAFLIEAHGSNRVIMIFKRPAR